MRLWIILLLLLYCIPGTSAAQSVELGCKRLYISLDPLLTTDIVNNEWSSGKPRNETPARLELAGCNGQLLDRFVLDSPLAKIDPIPVQGAFYPTYLVSADVTAESGSYNGPLTIPIQIINNRLVPAVAQWPDKSRRPIHLAETLKQSWRRVAHGHIDNFYAFSCWPKKSGGFKTSFMRYTPFRQGWKVKIRSEDGLWESDNTFPSKKRFP